MNKKVLLLGSILTIALLAFVTYRVIKDSGKSDKDLLDFSISDTSKVDKIVITDAFSNKITLKRDGKNWTDAQGGCIAQTNIQLILQAFKNIEFKGYLPEKSVKKFTNLMTAQHTKVEIFIDGDWNKTWYIGPAAQDHYGQIMLLETEGQGKAKQPVIMKLKDIRGIIEPRFFADKRKWVCTKIFELKQSQIATVDVQNIDKPNLNFQIDNQSKTPKVLSNGKLLTQPDTMMIFRYLQNFKKIHFNLANYELNQKQVDSLKQSKPFSILTLKEKNGKTTRLRMFRIKRKEAQKNEFAEVLTSDDMDSFWCEINGKDLVKCQYFVFNSILIGEAYFPELNSN
jgi:hypothetical protein